MALQRAFRCRFDARRISPALLAGDTIAKMQLTANGRGPLFAGVAISACLVGAFALFPEDAPRLAGLGVIAGVVAVALLMPPILGGLAIWTFVRWLNRRGDPGYTKCSHTDLLSSWGRRCLGWCRRLVWFGLGAAIPYAGWFVYRSISEPLLLRAHSRLMTLLVEEDFDGAYRLTTDEYQARHSVREFQSAFAQMAGDDFYDPLHASVISCGLSSARVYGREYSGFFELLSGPAFFYVKEHGEWRFTGKMVEYLD